MTPASHQHNPIITNTFFHGLPHPLTNRSISILHMYTTLHNDNGHEPVLRWGWVMEKSIEDHVMRVKNRLEIGRSVLEHLENVTTYDIEGVEPDMEQTAFPPPLPDDRFYVATDERDPDALRVISDAGGVFLTDLLEMEDRRTFGWPLMLTDVRGILEQSVLAHSAFFYGHKLSSYAGRVANLRAARGADRHTTLTD